jgi:hypothetical protein
MGKASREVLDKVRVAAEGGAPIAGTSRDELMAHADKHNAIGRHWTFEDGDKKYRVLEQHDSTKPLPPPAQQTPFMIKGLEPLYRDQPGLTPTPAPQQPLSPTQAAQEAHGGNDPRLDAMALQAAGIANPAINSRLK